MASRGYDGSTTPVVEPFTREQRQRLEALTFARKLVGVVHNDAASQPIHLWLRLAEFIIDGSS